MVESAFSYLYLTVAKRTAGYCCVCPGCNSGPWCTFVLRKSFAKTHLDWIKYNWTQGRMEEKMQQQ